MTLFLHGADSPRAAAWIQRLGMFHAVGALGIALQTVLLFGLTQAGLHYLWATALAVETTIVHNFLWHRAWTWRERRAHPWPRTLLKFHLGNGAVSMAGNLILMRLLVGSGGVKPAIANLFSITLCGLLNFWLADRMIFRKGAILEKSVTKGNPKSLATSRVHGRERGKPGDPNFTKESQSRMKKRVFLVAAVVVLGLANLVVAADKPDLSGKWSMDAAKSDFGPMPPPETMVMEIAHKDPQLTIKTSQKGAQGETTSEAKYSTDGKETTNTRQMGGNSMEVKTVTTWDGAKLVMVSKLDFQGNEVEIKDTLEVAEGGKVMNLARDIKAPQGEFTSKIVLNKQ